jgi:hypothetical protein
VISSQEKLKLVGHFIRFGLPVNEPAATGVVLRRRHGVRTAKLGSWKGTGPILVNYRLCHFASVDSTVSLSMEEIPSSEGVRVR